MATSNRPRTRAQSLLSSTTDTLIGDTQSPAPATADGTSTKDVPSCANKAPAVSTDGTYSSQRPALPSTQDKVPSADMYDKIVEIVVGSGDNVRTFLVHDGALCFYSGYFTAALHGSFSESRDGRVVLDTEDPDIFNLFRHWLYTRKLPEPMLGGAPREDMSLLCRLHTFADRRQIPLLMNMTLNKIKDKAVLWCNVLALDFAQFIYDNTTTKSGLRRMFVRILSLAHASPETLLRDTDRDKWPQEAVWDLIQAGFDQTSEAGL